MDVETPRSDDKAETGHIASSTSSPGKTTVHKEVEREDPDSKYQPTLRNLNGHIFRNVRGFSEKYFEGKPWSPLAEQLAKDIGTAVSSILFDDVLVQNVLDLFLGQSLVFEYKLPPGRSQYRRGNSHPLSGFDELDTPTLYLVHTSSQTPKAQHEWADVQAIGQCDTDDPADYRRQMLHFCTYAWRVFNNQPTRRVLHGFHISGLLVTLWVFDRAGAYSCVPFHIRTEPRRFLVAVAGYAMMSDEELGVDTFIQNDREGKYIMLTSKDDSICERLNLRERVRSHPGVVYSGPTCYRAERTGPDAGQVVVKFTWRTEAESPEEDILRKIAERKVWGVVQLFGNQDITSICDLHAGLSFESAVPLPLDRRSDIEGPPPASATKGTTISSNAEPSFPDLTFCCIAVHPVGRPIEAYSSISELLCAFIDIIRGHRSLYQNGRILHQDVSPGNIMITDRPAAGAPRGFLIDLDAARSLEASPATGERKGTRAFMALGVLDAKPHTYRHDMESLFYCLIWVAVCPKNGKMPPGGSRLWGWFQGGFAECAERKRSDIVGDGFEGVLNEFAEGLGGLKGLARELRTLLFTREDAGDEDADAFYDEMEAAFGRALLGVREKI